MVSGAMMCGMPMSKYRDTTVQNQTKEWYNRKDKTIE